MVQWSSEYADGSDFSSLSEDDLADVMDNPLTNMVIFDNNDYEAYLVMHIFKSLQFNYGMSSRPIGYNYEALKDNIKWKGLKPKKYVPLITQMFYSYINHLPSQS